MLPLAIRKQCESILREGCEKLGLSMGVVSHIYLDWYELAAVLCNTGVFVAGETFSLGETYCRDVVSSRKTLAITEFDGVQGMQRHPLYHVLALEAYISTPILTGDSVWGTLNFSSMRVRDREFSAEEISFVESSAEKISALISQN